jgi:hypothetical protein
MVEILHDKIEEEEEEEEEEKEMPAHPAFPFAVRSQAAFVSVFLSVFVLSSSLPSFTRPDASPCPWWHWTSGRFFVGTRD